VGSTPGRSVRQCPLGTGEGRDREAPLSRSVRLRPEASLELLEAWSWYESQRVGLGDELVACVDATIGAVARDPDLFQVAEEPTRRALVRRFPYAVFFVPLTDEIVVLAVHHVRGDPRAWRVRAASEAAGQDPE
jgi:plasmid stabilization system protein ParE